MRRKESKSRDGSAIAKSLSRTEESEGDPPTDSRKAGASKATRVRTR